MGKKQTIGADDIARDLGLQAQVPSSKGDIIAKDLGIIDKNLNTADFNIGEFQRNKEAEAAFDASINKMMDELPGLNDAEKKTILDLGKTGQFDKAQINEIIDTFRGAHPIQQKYVADDNKTGKTYLTDINPLEIKKEDVNRDFWGTVEETAQNVPAIIGQKLGQGHYYMKDMGNGIKVPVPLAVGQSAEAGHTVDSIWGSDQEAQDDSRVTDISKKLFNLIPSTVQGILSIGELGQGLTTGKTESAFKVAKQELESYKMATSAEKNKSIIDTEKVKEFSDIFSSDIYDLSPDKILNTAVNAGTSILQLFATRGALGFAGTSGKIANLGTATAGFTTNLSEPLKAADDAGIEGRSKYAVAALYSTIATAIEMKLGVEAKILNKETQALKNDMIKNLIKNNVKIVDGKITKESVEKLMEETTKKTTSFWAKHGKNALGEATEEVLQNMTQNGIQEIHDNLMKDDPESAKYNTKFWSPKALAEYMNSAVSGAIGGTGGSVVIGNKQSESVYNAIEQGPEKVNELKTDLVSSLKRGKISQDDFDRANFKIDAYNQYFQATKDRPIPSEDKRTIFDLTYQKENLKGSIESLENNNPGGINDGLIANKKKQVEEITKQVNDIWAKAETANAPKETPVPHWSEKVAEVSKETANPSNTITQTLVNKDKVNDALGLSPELNNLAKEFEVEFKTPSMTPEMPNIRIKNGEMIIPTETEVKGKEGTVEKKIVDVRIPAYAIKDQEGNTWIFGHNENASEDKGSSYLVKLNEDGSFDDAQEFKFETTKKNELNMDDLPKVFDTLGIKPIATTKAATEEFEYDEENDPVIHPDEAAFNSAYQSVTSGTNTGTVSANPNGTYKVNIDGRDVNFASTKHIKMENMPEDGVVAIEAGQGEFGETLLVKNPVTGEEIGYLRATPQSKGKIKEDVTSYENEAVVEIPYNLSPEAQTILNAIEKDQDNYELVEDDLGRRYKNKKTGEEYSTVSEFVGGKFKGSKGLKETAFGAGRMVGGIVKDFFNGKIASYNDYANHISRADYDDIINQLMEIKKLADEKGYSIITKKLILADDKNKIAGSPEILMVDKDGNFYVYDVATLKNAKRLNMKDLLSYKYSEASMSNGQRISSQVNIYADILKNKFNVDVNKVGVIPFEVDYTVGTKEKPFMIDYAKQNKRVDFKRKQILKYGRQEQEKSGGVQKDTGQAEGGQKAKAIRTGTKKQYQKIKSPAYIKALEFEATDPFHIALQYFINKGNVSPKAVLRLFKGDNTEIKNRVSYLKKDAPDVKEIAHMLWEQNEGLKHDTLDYENAIEDVINRFNSRSAMADEINKTQEVKFSKDEATINEIVAEAEQEGLDEDFDTYTDAYEELSDIEAQKIIEDQEAFESWYDAIRAEEAKKNLDLPSDIVSGDEDQFQKESKAKGDVQKVIESLKKANPKLRVYTDTGLVDKQGNPAAAKVDKQGNVVINPNYAGKDTPIHEVGHILIDAIGGLNNLVIRKAVKQLKNTSLWKEIEARYPELSEDMLAKEVLAEAIGREGAGIFETEEQKSSFRKSMEYIFDRIKAVFGINKNIAKSLAKEVLAGRYKVPSEMKEQFQKNKKTPKLTREAYYKQAFPNAVQLKTVENEIVALEAKLKTKLTPEEKKEFQRKLDSAQVTIDKFEKAFKKYSYDYNKLNKIKENNGDLSSKSIEELTEIYNLIAEYDPNADSSFFNEVKYRIAHQLAEQQVEFLEKKGVNPRASKFEDLSSKDVLMKSLGHMSEAFPEVQQLSKQYDAQNSKMSAERQEKLDKLNELAKVVAKEEASSLGLKFKDFLVGKGDQFFKWMDAGDGKFITTAQAKALSPAKGAYMEYLRSILDEYKDMQENTAAGYDENAALRVDKGFIESFKTSGIVAAIQKWAGTGETLRKVKIKFTDASGNTSVKSLGEIEKILQQEGEKGLISKSTATTKSVYYNLKAKKAVNKGIDDAGNVIDKGMYSLKGGKLINKFGAKRADDFDYSTNFHAAAVQYINDMTWSKYMQPLIPVVESIEHFNNVTGLDRNKKDNLVKWIKKWKAMHLYQETQTSPFPALDLVMKNLRHLTSMAMLAFNVPAAKMNLAIGEYNTWRELGTEYWYKGHKRLLASTKGGKKKFSTKATNIIKKYNVVSTDYDEKPNVSAGKIFDQLAQGMTRLTEYTIQGSMFLGQMTTQEWNDFDSQGNYTGSNPDIQAKLESYKKKVSDVHGKYSAKDRRNFELYEFGKFVGQFKTWVPDWWKERFGSRYFDENGKEHYGNWRAIQYNGIKQLHKDILTKEFWTSNDIKHKAMRTNLKSAMTFALLLSIRLSGDDDRKKKKAGDFLSQALGNLTFVFDPQQAQFVLKNPVAGMGTALKFVDALNSAVKAETYKSKGKFGDKGDLTAPGKFARITPYNKIVFNDLFMDEK